MPDASEVGGGFAAGVTVPQSFLDMPRWWSGERSWLASLPRAIAKQTRKWRLSVDGEVAHGSNAIAVPVVRDSKAYVLRMSPPGREVADHVEALRFWDGRGTVQLIEADVEAGALLLERLMMDQSLDAVAADEAVAVLARMMRRLAIPAPAHVASTAAVVERRERDLEREWHALGRPFDGSFVTAALEAASQLRTTTSQLAVDADLHSGQVLRASREPWLTIDPVLLRGDIEYDLARVLWTRIDDMPDALAIMAHFAIAVEAAALDWNRARRWVVFRAVDYWLWGLSVGLTEDPRRCQRLVAAILA